MPADAHVLKFDKEMKITVCTTYIFILSIMCYFNSKVYYTCYCNSFFKGFVDF